MTADAAAERSRKRRRATADAPRRQTKAARPHHAGPQKAALIGPHEDIVAQLQPKYDVHVASIISSTQIRTRVQQAVAHVGTAADRPRVVLLHARPPQVCKMITVAEQCKRHLADGSKACVQYNQLFDAPARAPQVNKVNETVLDKDGQGSDSDEFEVMRTRFDEAVFPSAPARTVKSMRIFLSSNPIQELEKRDDVTVQKS
ncbi:hypothetical protein HIM_02258 [Hirsutella minnesotensis 3608]|nr:hypothetical protein HIM_02258 [Hirsutella minnesotensis 3608]